MKFLLFILLSLNLHAATIETIAGTGWKGSGPDSPDPLKCQMARPHGIGVDLYIGDSGTNKVRVIHFK